MFFTSASPAAGLPSLSGLPWLEDPLRALRDARRCLTEDLRLVESLGSYLRSLSSDELVTVMARSTERTTHYKWFLSGDGRYRVWLHQYRSSREYANAPDFAASIHNHRYPFTSKVLSGGLHVRTFHVQDDESVLEAGTQQLGAGQTMLLSHEDVHQVAAVDDGTLTIVVQGPPQRRYSTVWMPSGAASKQIFDLDHLFEGLVAGL